MKELNEEAVCVCKRGREDGHENTKPDQQKKPRSDSWIVEYIELEEDFIDNIDEGRVCNIMRELMEEIGLIKPNTPLFRACPLALSFQSSAEVAHVSCDSAISSTSCSSTSSDPHNSPLPIEVDSAKRQMDRVEGDCCQQEDFPEIIGAGGVMMKYDSVAWSMFNRCTLDTEYGMWQALDEKSPLRTFKSKEK